MSDREVTVTSSRWFLALAVSEMYVLAVYVLARFTDTDLTSISGVLRVLLVAAAALVAVVAYQAWSKGPTTQTTCAMVTGLLGGAALASTVVSAAEEQIYSSATLAALGTAGVVVTVAIAQVAIAREKAKAS